MTAVRRVLTPDQLRAGVAEANRIIRDATGYWFGGEIIPFAPELKALALDAVHQLYQTVHETPNKS